MSVNRPIKIVLALLLVTASVVVATLVAGHSATAGTDAGPRGPVAMSQGDGMPPILAATASARAANTLEAQRRGASDNRLPAGARYSTAAFNAYESSSLPTAGLSLSAHQTVATS